MSTVTDRSAPRWWAEWPRLRQFASRIRALFERTGRALRAAGAWLRARIDARDVLVFGGLGVAAVGGWQLSHAITLIALGLALALMGWFS